MGLLDFLFGGKKKEEELKRARSEKKRAEEERKKAEAERRRMEKDRELFENLLEERTKQLQYYIDKHNKETQKSQEYIKQLVEKTKEEDLTVKDSDDKKKIKDLKKQLKEKDNLLQQEKVKATMEFYAKQAELEEELHKRQGEMEAMMNRLKEEEQLREDGGDYRSAEMIRLEEELKNKEEEFQNIEGELTKQKETKGEDMDDGEMDSLMKQQLEDMQARKLEIQTLEEQLKTELVRIKDLRGQRRSEFEAKLGGLRFDNYVVGPSNEFPFQVCQSVAETPAEAYNPLYIYGAVGLGKTHLLSAIGNHILAKDPKMVVTYVSSEAFTNELITALEENQLEEFREKYRNVDVLLVDDIQFIGKTQNTQEEFFHTFNALYNANKQIIIASDRPPKEIQTLEDRLRSRFEGGLITDIKSPDEKTRMKILKAKAEAGKVKIPKDVLKFLSSNISSNIRTLIGGLNKVTAYASITNTEMSVEMAEKVLSDVLDGEGKQVELEQVEE